MTDNPFGNGNENPQFKVIDSNRDFFFTPDIQDRDLRTNIFQGHHIIPNNVFDDPDPDFRSFWTELLKAGYAQDDPATNQA